MNLPSFDSLIFFSMFFVSYWLMPGRLYRQIFLLAGSTFFCAWAEPRFLLVLFGTTIVIYVAGILMEKVRKKYVLIITLSILILNLAVFKYFNFFISSFVSTLNSIGFQADTTTLNIILPIGISFYTFQAISYVVDIYRHKLEPENNLLTIAIYMSFFPRLVAGPIVRATDFLPQLKKDVRIDSRDFFVGLKLFFMGFIYKSVVADNLAIFVDPIYGQVTSFNNYSLSMASFGYYSQIYFDFAGYSLMAIGIARLLGYKLQANFYFPYIATSITDFWRRWHISFSTWLRDYLYIPLGGNRGGFIKENRNLMLTMLLGGLWHGASWNFVLWGGLHGIALIYLRFLRKFAPNSNFMSSLQKTLTSACFIACSWFATQFFIMACWVPFRADSFADTWIVLQALLNLRDDSHLGNATIPYGLLFIPFVVDTFVIRLKRKPIKIGFYKSLLQYALLGILLAFLLLMVPLEVKRFIYGQF